MFEPLSLSRTQIKASDRVGGCEIILPWPEGLPPGPKLALDEERDATPQEHLVAEQIIGDAARAAGLVPVRSMVAVLRRPGQLPRHGDVEQHLIVLLIGRRWVHAGGWPIPRRSWVAI